MCLQFLTAHKRKEKSMTCPQRVPHLQWEKQFSWDACFLNILTMIFVQAYNFQTCYYVYIVLVKNGELCQVLISIKSGRRSINPRFPKGLVLSTAVFLRNTDLVVSARLPNCETQIILHLISHNLMIFIYFLKIINHYYYNYYHYRVQTESD